MKAFSRTWFKPEHQVKGKPEVEFELQPLDQRTQYIVQSDKSRRGIGIDGATAAFDHCVTNWKGLEVPYSAVAKREVLNQVGDINWTIWLAEISVKAYIDSLVTESDAKNS